MEQGLRPREARVRIGDSLQICKELDSEHMFL